ncbi:MAG TPA: phosphoribosylformylglycinamidine cyclo-ligase [Clostridia bacterium]|nr:phosphoribosylformylglycinamidine cyclo-ligase [Clostridia bacterium]
MAITYKDSGVDVEAGYEAVKLMKQHVKRTLTAGCIGDIGSFGGFYSLSGELSAEPVLVAGTDGVGTKLKIAFAMDKHDTIGIDCVAMCANDVICQGAKPLFFLDYIATPKLEPRKVADIVKGISDGCVQAGCALIGGETAEMPGLYSEGEYDLAGFCVGIVDKSKIIDGSGIKAGDAIIGIASSGIHSNGYSLVRKLFDINKEINTYFSEFGSTLGEELIRPTKIYVKIVLELLKKHSIKGLSHITGGGFIENIPRMLTAGCGVDIKLGSWDVPAVFEVLRSRGELEDKHMFNTFNMGIGLTMAVSSQDADAVIKDIRAAGEKAYIIGTVTDCEGGVRLCR